MYEKAIVIAGIDLRIDQEEKQQKKHDREMAASRRR